MEIVAFIVLLCLQILTILLILGLHHSMSTTKFYPLASGVPGPPGPMGPMGPKGEPGYVIYSSEDPSRNEE